MENLKIANSHYKLEVKNSMLDGSSFSTVSLKNLRFDDVTMTGMKISNANLTAMEINGARLSGAIFRNIGIPPKGHPAHSPENKHDPLTFENCDLSGSSYSACNFEGVELVNCNIKGLKINGILIENLLNDFQR
jgi:uncharacterized protein YjbI with pentapeptide repeats